MKRYAFILTLCLVAVIARAAFVYAQPEFSKPFGVAPVTANFIYKLIEYVSWPSKNSNTVICTVGDGEVGDILKKINNDPDFKRNLTIRNVVNAYDNCHILYVGSGDLVTSVINKTRAKPILTVSDISGFAENGGVVGFVYRNESVSMEVSLKALRRSGLTIDAELLGLMDVVD